MFTLRTSILAIGLLVSSTLGVDSSQRAHCQYNHICFSSFVWCPNSEDEGLGAGKSCTAGPNVYPRDANGYWAVGAISASDIHQLDWRNMDENYKVLVELINVDENYGNKQVLWSGNFTNEWWLHFQLTELAEHTAKVQGKNDSREILGLMLSGYSWFKISQPDRPSSNSSGDWDDVTSHFVSFQRDIKLYVETQGEIVWNNMFERWRLTMGLCLGLAVPVAAALAFLGGMFLEKRRASCVHKPLPKYVDDKE